MILSIETSTDVCSVALHREEKLLAYSELFTEKSHSSSLTLLIESMIKHIQAKMSELEGIALSQGPGSYTGLRVGTSVAKGLCYALEIPLFAVDSLLVMAHHVKQILIHQDFLLCPMIDARRMEVYTTLINNDFQIILPTQALVFDKIGEEILLGKLPNRDAQILLFGNGARKCKQASSTTNFVLLENIYPSAKAVGELYYLGQAKSVDVAYFEPDYLKPFYTQANKLS